MAREEAFPQVIVERLKGKPLHVYFLVACPLTVTVIKTVHELVNICLKYFCPMLSI